MIRYVLILIILFTYSCSNLTENNSVKTTAIYTGKYKDLIEAVKDENISAIEKIVQSNNLKLDYADPSYGVSLLNWCIFNKKEKSFEKLIQLGASVNWQDENSQFAPPITEAARLDYTSVFLELAIRYNGNIDLLSKKMSGSEEQTPLFSAIYSKNINNVKILVQKGANVNLTQDSIWTPLAEALIQDKIEIAKYLLDNGANYNSLKLKSNLGKELNILDLLRKNQFPLHSNEHTIKVEIINFLKLKGLDYQKYPIPEKVMKQHEGDSNYLLNY